MRIGYPCINRSIGCTASRTFRLTSYSEDRLRDTVRKTLPALKKSLSTIPCTTCSFFGSHPIWYHLHRTRSAHFPGRSFFPVNSDRSASISGDMGSGSQCIRYQFVLLNASDEGVLRRSIADLEYQVQVLDLMGLDNSAKVQVHVGGVYGNKPASMDGS